MKQLVIFLCLAASLAVVMTACQADGGSNKGATIANSNTAAPPPTSVSKEAVANEVRETLTAHDKALNEKNLDAVMATFSTDPKTVVLGTGSEEKWQGPQEIRAAYTEILKDYDANTLQCPCDWKTGGADEGGTMAWLAAICSCKDSMKGKSREYKLNVSAALEKQDGKWRFVVLHMSNAFQPPVTK